MVAAPPLGIERSALPAITTRVLNRGNSRNPDVFLVEVEDREIVVKDFAPRSALVRATLGRWLTAREAAAYRWLEGHPAVPSFLGSIDPLAFALEFRPGRRVSRHLLDDAGPDFIASLARAVDELHTRGLVHLDLGHRSNVLVDDRGEPVLIDFASALWFRPGGLAARLCLPALVGYDQRAVAKYREKLERQRSLRAEGQL
ncbi:MAG: hypothetical protein JRH10_16750 [Deltaproteobacteria bacterium]|nr:hypothetical protein [Deltaproteobacteria bacterium]MBW2444959.1 hypothetical protein [Deltaproteobacteria bacterium]